jgi:FkbM family methyltransferase
VSQKQQPPNGRLALLASSLVRGFEAVSIRGAPTILSILSRLDVFRRADAIIATPGNTLIHFPAFDHYWARYLWANAPYERDVEQIFRKLGSNRVLIDCGANIGYWTVRAPEFGFRRVIAVEANPALLRFLENNVRLNGISAEILHRAVYSTTGETVMLAGTESHASAGLGPQGVPVESISLDDLLRCLSPDEEAIAKLDIEGAEIAALKSAGSLEKAIVVYEDFAKHGMPVTQYVLGRGLAVFGVTAAGAHRRIESVDDAVRFNAENAVCPGAPSNLIACTMGRAKAIDDALLAN